MFYENYLNSLKPDTSYIPESASFNDMTIFAQRAYQDAYNEAFFALASQEMAVFEAAIHEEDGGAITSQQIDARDKKGLLEIVKNAISTIWQKVKGFFSDIITRIQKKFADFKKEQGDKIKNDFKKGVANLKDDYKAKGIYKFEWLKKQDVMDKANAVADLAKKAYDDALADNWADTYNKDAIAKALGFDSADNFKIEAPEKVEVTAADIKSAQQMIINTVFDPNGMIKRIKIAYKAAKKSVDDALKSAKSAMGKGKENRELNAACKSIISFCRDCSSMITKFVGKNLSVFLAVRANWAALMAKIAIKGSKKKEEKVSEDTEITIDVKDDKADETNVEVNQEPAPEVKDEVEEAFAALMEEDEEVVDDVEATEVEAEGKGCKSCKEDVDIEVNVEDDDDDDEDIEESALYKALVAYLG